MAADDAAVRAPVPEPPAEVSPVEPVRGTVVALKDFLKQSDDDDDGAQDFIKSMVFGGLDGIITTFAVVAAGAGADLEGKVVVLMGFANLVSDGISMGLGDYFSEKSENEFIRGEKKRELWEMENNPEGEVQEMIEIFMDKKKLTEDDATEICTTYGKYPVRPRIGTVPQMISWPPAAC